MSSSREVYCYFVKSTRHVRFVADDAPLLRPGEEDRDSGAASHRAPDGDLALVEFDEFTHYGKSKSRAARAAGARWVGTVERLKDSEEVFSRDADAGVLEDKLDIVTRRIVDSDANMPSARRVLERVLEEVADYLRECGCVAPHLRLGALAESHLVFTALGELREFLDDVGRDRREIHPREFDTLGLYERGE